MGGRHWLAGCLLVLLLLPVFAQAAAVPPLEDFFRDAEFTGVTLSPDGTHIAVTVPRGDRTGIAVLRIADRSLVGNWDVGKDRHIHGVLWVTNERLLYEVELKLGSFDLRAQPVGLMLANRDGKRRVEVPKGHQYHVIGRVPGEPGQVWVSRFDHYSYLHKLDSRNGNVGMPTQVELLSADFVLDHDGTLRYAVGYVDDGRAIRTVRREDDRWVTVHQTGEDGTYRVPWMFAPDNRRVYFAISDEGEPARVVLLDPETGDEELVAHHPVVDPAAYVRASDRKHLLAIRYHDGLPNYEIIERAHPEARLLAGLIQAFPDHSVAFSNLSDDGRRIIFQVYSDVDPGSYYLFDRETGAAQFLLSARGWIVPDRMARTQPIAFDARDGQRIHGYLTIPNGAEPKDLPLVVYIHGGPHGIRDYWGFDRDVQALASRGYAVLQVNFRGSGGYGAAFEWAGMRRWGTTTQDDIADGVRWVIEKGVVDADRVCLYGASFGGYSALMGPAREPDLYRCAIGYAGIYSLPGMFRWGDIRLSDFGKAYLEDVLPVDEDEQRAQSPSFNAAAIGVPVMLVHGGDDQRAPIQHFSAMRDALKGADNAPRAVIVENREGHGFQSVKANVRLYETLFRFLEEHNAETR